MERMETIFIDPTYHPSLSGGKVHVTVLWVSRKQEIRDPVLIWNARTFQLSYHTRLDFNALPDGRF